MMLYEQVTDLPVHLEAFEMSRHERDTSSGFTRTTTVVSMHGSGETGRGEDVTYDGEAHDELLDSSPRFPITGTYTVNEFSDLLTEIDLFHGTEPGQSVFRNYRRWAFESAVLDLALRQQDTNLADHLDRRYEPVRFVVSTRLEEPPTGDRILRWLDRDPAIEFKLDPTSDWTPAVIDRLAKTDAVCILDLKGQYHDTIVDQPADAELYENVLRGFPSAIVEDPALTEETTMLFEPAPERVAWDYPIRSVDTIESLPWTPTWLNIKPSRFGSIQQLFNTLDYCANRGIQLYGGGQFELAIGREHLHTLASLFYPDAPNDVAPTGYNDPDPRDDLPQSPLTPPSDPRGLAWR